MGLNTVNTVATIPIVPLGSMQKLLHARWLYHAGIAALIFIFWGSGLLKALDFNNALCEMAHFGPNPPEVFAIAIAIATVITGSHLP
ncbi:MAG: DoxX family membrane protein [Polaromonas sp.]|nr:DoxX family membrane protein [Polaromonas sp.]